MNKQGIIEWEQFLPIDAALIVACYLECAQKWQMMQAKADDIDGKILD